MHANDSLNDWRTAKLFSIDDADVEEGIDYHTLSVLKRSIDLDTIIDAERVVTGVRFNVVNSHIRLEVQFTKFDYETGKLVDIQLSEWVYNNSTRKIALELQRPHRSTETRQKSIPVRGVNHYINFQPSDIEKDGAQSVVPFLDKSPIETKALVVGVGIYLKTQHGYGGFIAPRLVQYNSLQHIQPINGFK